MKMFTRHVAKQLSAYLHGELSKEKARRTGEHLLRCERCRREYDDIKLGAQLAERLPLAQSPAEMWSEIESLLDAQSRERVYESPARRFDLSRRWYLVAAASAALVFIIIFGARLFRNVEPTPKNEIAQHEPTQRGESSSREKTMRASWEVESLAGKIRVGGETLSGTGRLAVGDSLETENASRAKIKVANIGEVELEPNSRVRLIETTQIEHRLALDRGTMRAKINAPPRLFFVNTPSAEAIDLGCAYTLEVDDTGRSFLHVTAGWVMLARDGREAYVPIGAMCETRPSTGPGTPYFDDAPRRLRESLSRFDFEYGGDDALQEVLRYARPRDSFTLWHLLQRVNEVERNFVLDRMIALVGLPEGVTRDGVLNLDPQMLELWKDELDTVWF